MRRELLAPLVLLVVLLAAAGGVLAATSLGSEGDDVSVPEAGERTPPLAERERELDRLLPERERPLPLRQQQPFVGIALDDEGGDVVVERVVRGSPAARAGIREGDVIEAVGGKTVDSANDLAAIVGGSERGDILTFRIRRDGEEREIEVRVGQRPVAPDSRDDGLRSLPPLEELFGFFEIPNLREKLSERFERFVGASITFLDEDGELVTLRLVAGTVAGVSDDAVVVAPNAGIRLEEFRITKDTRIVRGLRPAHADDLEPGDRVLVVARDDGREASVILAFPAHEEESEG